jgi:arylsulfatase A-like enzyme
MTTNIVKILLYGVLFVGLCHAEQQASCPDLKQNMCMKNSTAIEKYDGGTAEECCEKCASNSACVAYTMNIKRNLCFLHPETADFGPGNCTSGIVRAPTPEPTPAPAPKGAKNVLFLIADDLRPQLNKAYGKSFMHTPNIDAFTDTALVFDWAYTNMAICSASRNSFLSGRVPDKTRTWNFIDDFRESGPDWITLPEFFKHHGYTTLGHGKLYHPGHPYNNDEPKSWSQDQPYVGLTTTRCDQKNGGGNYCPDGVSPDNMFSDHNTTLAAIDTIQRVTAASKTSGKPWFIGMGWHYPHQSWHTPQWVQDKYPDPMTLPAPAHPFSPEGVPDVAFTAELDGKPSMSLNEALPGLAKYKPATAAAGMNEFIQPRPGNNTFPAWFTQQLRLGYYTAVTHMDWHFGMVMKALEDSGQANDTLVVMTGDHGWQLGEHTEWGKHTNFDLATHVPLLIRAPWKPKSMGTHAKNTRAELVDLYRTLVSLAGLDANDVDEDVDGIDLSAVFNDVTASVRNYSFSQYSRCPGARNWPKVVTGMPDWYMNNCETVPAQNISYMGYTVRSPEYRYTMWFHWDGATCDPKWDSPLESSNGGHELYSHVNQVDPGDFDSYENKNLANDPTYASIVKDLQSVLLFNFRGPGKSIAGCPSKKLSDFDGLSDERKRHIFEMYG